MEGSELSTKYETAAHTKTARVHWWRAFHWNSFWVIITAVTLGISLTAVLIVTSIIIRHADTTINTSIAQNNSQIVSNVTDSINQYIAEMVLVSNTISDLLPQYTAEKLDEKLVVLLRDDIETIVVFDYDGNIILNTGTYTMRKDLQLTRQSWFRGATSSNSGYMISEPHVQRLFRGHYPWVITLTRGVEWEQDGIHHTGIVMVDMNFTNIRNLCARDFENDGYLYITNEKGDVVYHPKQQMIYAGILPEEITLTAGWNEGEFVTQSADKQLAVRICALEDTGWRVVGVATMDGFGTYGNEPDTYVLTAIVLLAVALLAGSLAVGRYMVRPLYRLITLMGEMSDGEMMPDASTGGIYEVGQLGKSFNRMVQRIRHLMVQVRTEQEQLRRSEVKTLYAQINPHFLYNTLDSVIWLAESGDEENVVHMVMALSKYFRLSLSRAKDFITVSEELQQVENYLIIQKMRFCNSFTYTITCEDAVRLADTPKILLQPIVENAIVHGVGTMEEGGIIEICAFVDGEDLVMQVKDNGYGVKPETLAHILETDAASGIGLKNVHQRIRLLCGQSYGLTLTSELDEGTMVSLRLPLRFKNPEKEG